MRFIECRCPNRPDSNSDKPCYGEMAGISTNTVEGGNGVSDMRYCPKCGCFWEISVDPDGKSMTYSIAEGEIDFVEADKYFDVITVVGRKLKK